MVPAGNPMSLVPACRLRSARQVIQLVFDLPAEQMTPMLGSELGEVPAEARFSSLGNSRVVWGGEGNQSAHASAATESSVVEGGGWGGQARQVDGMQEIIPAAHQSGSTARR